MMQGPSLRQLEYLVAVADEGQFSEAARVCAVSQPALSKQVQAAEELLGVTIFERSRPRVLVTDAGRPIIEQARKVLEQAEALLRVAEDRDGNLVGRVRLGVIPTVAPYVLPPLMQDLRDAYPEMELFLHEGQTDELVRLLKRGELDVVLMAFPVDYSGMEGVDIFREPFVLAAPEDAMPDLDGGLCLSQIAGRSLVLMEEGHCFRDHALEVCSLADAHEDNAVRATSLTTLCLMVRNGVASTLVPATALRTEFRDADDVTLRSFADDVPGRTIGLRWRPTSARAEAFRHFAETCREAISGWDLLESVTVEGPTPRLEFIDDSP